MKTLIKTAAAIALGTTAAMAVPAAAQTAPSVTVSFADLNLASERGTEIFDRRIENAIDQVCGGLAPRDVRRNLAYKECVEETAAVAKAQRDLAVNAYRDGRLANNDAMNDRVIRFAAN